MTAPTFFVLPNVKPKLVPLVRSLPVVIINIWQYSDWSQNYCDEKGYLDTWKHEDDAWNQLHIYVKKCINVKGCLYLVPFLSNFIIYTSSSSSSFSSTINNLYSSPSSSPTHSAIICHFCPLSSTASRSHSLTPSPLFFHLFLHLLLIASLVPPSISSPSRPTYLSLSVTPPFSSPLCEWQGGQPLPCFPAREMVFLSICPSTCLPNRLSGRIA